LLLLLLLFPSELWISLTCPGHWAARSEARARRTWQRRGPHQPQSERHCGRGRFLAVRQRERVPGVHSPDWAKIQTGEWVRFILCCFSLLLYWLSFIFCVCIYLFDVSFKYSIWIYFHFICKVLAPRAYEDCRSIRQKGPMHTWGVVRQSWYGLWMRFYLFLSW
jgi:hypothetical protein